jgi:preprotein translocase subunit SecG
MLLYYAIASLHVIVCVILVLVVLLQSGRGADLAGAFGGGATQTAFGSRGPASFLSKMTTIAAVVFMVTSIALSMISTKTEAKSILENTKQTAKPVAKKPAAQPLAPVPTPAQIKRIQEELEAKQKQQPAAPAHVQEIQKPAPKPAEAKKPAPERKP